MEWISDSCNAGNPRCKILFLETSIDSHNSVVRFYLPSSFVGLYSADGTNYAYFNNTLLIFITLMQANTKIKLYLFVSLC